MPRTLSSYGNWTFAAAGPHLWNSLPVQLCNPDISYGLFRWQLKGHLYREAWTRRSVTSDMLAPAEKHLLTYWLTYKGHFSYLLKKCSTCKPVAYYWIGNHTEAIILARVVRCPPLLLQLCLVIPSHCWFMLEWFNIGQCF